MGGVDKSDQLVVYCGLRWSSKKWRKRAFLHLMEPTMVNAYILYCYSTPKKERMTHLKFRLDVASRGSSSSTCSYITNLLLMLQTFPSDSLAVTSQNPLVAVLTAKSVVTEQQGKGNRLSGSVRHVKWLCVYTHALNATIPSSITSRFQHIVYTHQVHTNFPFYIYFHIVK